MARRGENIRKRKDGRWEARYKKGRNADGSIQYGYVYGRRYAEAKQKRNDALSLIKDKDDTPRCSTPDSTFDDLFNEWKTEVRSTIKESSFCFYETMLEQHLRPYFGIWRIDQLTAEVAQNFICLKLEQNLSPTYIRSIITLFQNILKSAQSKYQYAIQVPTFHLPKTPKKMPEIFTAREWKHLEMYLKTQNSEFAFGILICMYTGMRIGELSGLRWEDYDPINVQFKIRRTVYRLKNTAYAPNCGMPKTILCIGSPKTATSVRDIPLPFGLLNEIQKHQKSPKTFVLTGTEQCMEPRNIQKKYKKLLAQSGLRYLNFHSLRHSFATLSIQNGSDYRTVAELLGHSSVNTTLNIYVHSGIDQKRHCLDMLIN
ncbi:MAG: site-specific integrase [Acetatifactor sp.]|nr:site-specific integrase [Acetatifactor sp.]